MIPSSTLFREGSFSLFSPFARIVGRQHRHPFWSLLLVTLLLWGCGGQKPMTPAAPVAAPSVRTVITTPPAEPAPVRHMGQTVQQPGQTATRPVLTPVQIGPDPVQVAPPPGQRPPPGQSAMPPQKPAPPEEIALQQAELLHGEGKLFEAWHAWATIASGAEFPAANSFYTDKAWQRLLESYFFQASADNTPRFLQETAEIEPTASQHRILHEQIALQPRERIKYLLSLQPGTSMLAAALRAPLPDAAAVGAPQGKAEENLTSSVAPLAMSTTISQPPITAPAAPAMSAGGTSRKVGLLLPLSGKWTNMGEHLRRAAKKALADYPTSPLQLQIADSGDTPESSQKGVQELISQQVDVIIGPVFYATVQPAIELAAASQIPIITLNPQREGDPLLKGAYSNAFQAEQQAKIMAKQAVVEKKLTRIAILAPESEYGRGIGKTFTDEVHALGGAIVRSAYFAQDANDFSPWIKALGTQFDALFLPASAKQVRLIAPQVAAVRLGKQNITLLGTSLWNSPELLSEGGEYLEGALFCDIDNNAKEHFRQSFRQTWEEDPTALATLAYDGVAIIAQLLQEQSAASGKISHAALTRSNGFRGASGPVRFLDNGLSRRLYHIFRIEGGQIRPLQPVQDSLATP
ncbi:MAG: penicillin-binding protein activator [Magnetococcales bacterium]|nr:penicillin-binding protein activator [Magnetococcales bacterium]